MQAHAAHHARADPRRARDLLRHRASRSIAPSAAPTKRARKAAHERASLLTPVAKAFSTDIGIEVASLGVQVHGGMGFIEETGAAQHYRDARIAAIYEGTNGIQAIDLVDAQAAAVGRRARSNAYIAELRAHGRRRQCRQRSGLRRDRRAARGGGRQPRARDAVAARPQQNDPDTALAGATPYLRLFALRGRRRACWPRRRWRQRGSAATAQTPLRASRSRASLPRTSRCRPAALERTVVEGADSVNAAEAALA